MKYDDWKLHLLLIISGAIIFTIIVFSITQNQNLPYYNECVLIRKLDANIGEYFHYECVRINKEENENL